ncbi:SRPBCC family protein [Peristeroidobacter agariperforans]|uniref:SRPBCC family protein n=1 Tax=Peristeroidobacter agariperforans TaxID=268404 RepID=UPI00101C0861|nr:SRPBCC domain-containing protein [Peristeroidobacter agariperforans]
MFDILHRVGMKASLDKVYQALATPEGVAGWWTTETTGDRKAGGMIKFRFTDGGRELGVFNMKIVELRPNTRVVWEVVDGPAEWIGTNVRFELKQEDDFAVVLFKHEGWREPAEFMYHCSTKWGVFLQSLKSLIETGQGQPSPNDVKISNWH